MRKIVILSIFLFFLQSLNAQYQDCKGFRNNLKLIESQPKLLDFHIFGKKFAIYDQETNITVTILQVWGKPFEMGEAQGMLLKKEFQFISKAFIDYSRDILLPDIAKAFLPKFLQKLAKIFPQKAINILLDLNYYATKKFTDIRYNQELKGIAMGARISYKVIRRINMVPELIQAQCTTIGTWGKSTASGKLFQLRALDWDFNAPIVDYPLVTVYIPDEKGSIPFANIGYVGFIGVLTGFSKASIGLSEKLWLPEKDQQAALSRIGTPWMYVLRDTLQFSHNISEALQHLMEAKRTCAIHVGLGSSQDNSYRGIQYSANTLRNFDDKNYTYYNAAHPQLEGVHFWDSHQYPHSDMCLGAILKDNHGKITAETLYRIAAPLHKTGNTQLCVMDFENQVIYLSNSKRASSSQEKGIEAYTRSSVKIDLKSFFIRSE